MSAPQSIEKQTHLYSIGNTEMVGQHLAFPSIPNSRNLAVTEVISLVKQSL